MYAKANAKPDAIYNTLYIHKSKYWQRKKHELDANVKTKALRKIYLGFVKDFIFYLVMYKSNSLVSHDSI